jgi:hypothetical protein
MAELVLGRGGEPVAVNAWLARRCVGRRRQAIRREAGASPYRRLVRGRLRGPEIAIRARPRSAFDEYSVRYLAERGPRSHLCAT